MNQEKYIGMDVHAATISVAVMNAQGKLLMECVLQTQNCEMFRRNILRAHVSARCMNWY